MCIVRWLVVSLIAIGVVFGLTVSAQQRQSSQPQTTIKIIPEKPTSNDEIKIELSGTFPNSCIPEKDSAKVTVEYNQVTIATSNASEFCDDIQSKWSLSVPVGKKLAAGPYRVLVLFRMTKEPPDFLLGMERFAVTGGGALSDQTGQAGAVPFTMLPVVQTLDQSTVVPTAFLAVTVKGTKSNSDNRQASLPGTVGVPVGDVVEVTINASERWKYLHYNPTRCKAEQDTQIVDNCTPPFPSDKPIKVLITGPNPILMFLFEQTEPPDLTVQINATVRRYTEREQVFCDMTVLTRVSNPGKGSAGVVALRSIINSTKSNTFRWGMDSGGQATQVDVLVRLRPGQYLLEAEVESLSIKETNMANNKATQSVICR